MDHTRFFFAAFTATSRGKEINGCSSMFSKTAAVKFLLVAIACLHMHIVHRQSILVYSLKTEGRYLLEDREPNGGIPNIGMWCLVVSSATGQ